MLIIIQVPAPSVRRSCITENVISYKTVKPNCVKYEPLVKILLRLWELWLRIRSVVPVGIALCMKVGQVK